MLGEGAPMLHRVGVALAALTGSGKDGPSEGASLAGRGPCRQARHRDQLYDAVERRPALTPIAAPRSSDRPRRRLFARLAAPAR